MTPSLKSGNLSIREESAASILRPFASSKNNVKSLTVRSMISAIRLFKEPKVSRYGAISMRLRPLLLRIRTMIFGASIETAILYFKNTHTHSLSILIFKSFLILFWFKIIY
jgi:hypothetical protein